MLRFQISISLDGYSAGPHQSREEPLGAGGMQLHEWVFELAAWRREHGLEGGVENASTPVVEAATANLGATIMGKNMFGGGAPWEGWWGDEPPFHHPVFVLQHEPRPPLVLGETTFHFVNDGIESALEQAQAAAGGKDVAIGGGANVVQQYLAAGRVDEFVLHVVPVLLGGGERLFEGVSGVPLELADVVDAPGVVHLTYRRRRE